MERLLKWINENYHSSENIRIERLKEKISEFIEDTVKNKTNCCQADYSHIISHPPRRGGSIHLYICKSCGGDAQIPEKYHKQNCEIYEEHRKPRTDE